MSCGRHLELGVLVSEGAHFHESCIFVMDLAGENRLVTFRVVEMLAPAVRRR